MKKTFEILRFPFNNASTTPSKWEMWRHLGIDAEDAATIIGHNPWETVEELLLRKSQIEPIRKPATPAMVAGRANRPAALNAYRALSGIHNLEPASVQNIQNPWMIAHPDLMRGYHIADVHCGESALEKAHKSGKLPKPYWAEAQHTLMVTGYHRMTVYLHNVDPKMAAKSFEVHAHKAFQQELYQAESNFLAQMQTARAEALAASEASNELLERAQRLEATIQAITGTGPKVDLQTFREFVPKFLDRKGCPTEEGILLLRPLAIQKTTAGK
jgi:putative phage-type endonuclease